MVLKKTLCKLKTGSRARVNSLARLVRDGGAHGSADLEHVGAVERAGRNHRGVPQLVAHVQRRQVADLRLEQLDASIGGGEVGLVGNYESSSLSSGASVAHQGLGYRLS